jgi:GDP-D-mannose dehydratase
LEKLLSYSKTDIEVVVDESKFRPVDTPVLKSNNDYIKKELGLIPDFEIDITLEDILNYWREKENE